MAFSVLPTNMPSGDIVQMLIFLLMLLMVTLALISGWLGLAYTFSNLAYLIIAFYSIATSSPKSYYLYAYTSFATFITDILVISIQYGTYHIVVAGRYFFLGFVVALFIMIFKIFIGLLELHFAKTLNGEEGLPIDLSNMFSQTSRPANPPAPQPQPKATTPYPQLQPQPQQPPQQAPQMFPPPSAKRVSQTPRPETREIPLDEVDDL